MNSPATTAARPRKRRAGRPSPWGMFFRGFVKNPVMVGAVTMSSRAVINTMLGPVDWANCKLFVEYGPGVGTFCQHVLDRMAPDAQYIAIDTNEDFVAYLREDIRDPRFSAVHGSAADVAAIVADHGFESADYILSGLPFSTLPPGVGDQIAAATHAVIRTGGAFLVYQYHPRVRAFFAPYFEKIDHKMEWWNIPPAQLFWCWKA